MSYSPETILPTSTAPLPVPNSTAPPLHNSHSPPTGRRLGPAVGIPPSPPTSRALGPAVAIPPSPPTGRRLGPTGSYPSSPPLSSLVWEDRRQGSWDGGHSPVVRVESPLIFSGGGWNQPLLVPCCITAFSLIQTRVPRIVLALPWVEDPLTLMPPLPI